MIKKNSVPHPVQAAMEEKSNALQFLPPELRHVYHYAILFLSPKSKKWGNLKQLLQKVTHYEKDDNFIALFQPSLNDFAVLYACLQTTAGWKSATYYYKNEIISRSQMLQPVECVTNLKELAGHVESCLTEDIIYGFWQSDGIRNNIKFIIPCKHARGFGYKKIGGDYAKMFLAHAQECGVTMCPFFNMNNFKGPFYQQDNLHDMTATISVKNIIDDLEKEKQQKESKSSFFSNILRILKK